MAVTSTCLHSATREPDSSFLVCLFAVILPIIFIFLPLLSNMMLISFAELPFLGLHLLCSSTGGWEGQKQRAAPFVHQPESMACSSNNFSYVAHIAHEKDTHLGPQVDSVLNFATNVVRYSKQQCSKLRSQSTENGWECCISLFSSIARGREADQKSVTGPHKDFSVCGVYLLLNTVM